jgi:hypothetical protein
MRNVLLLTATVTPPPGVPSLQRTNPAERLRDYEEALSFYLPLVDTLSTPSSLQKTPRPTSHH